ncbi:bleomycin resistance protein [Nocardioides sp.]|uniref:bleomycin resistance protein n=1 Tax=Nocardioides sp. TaxID=35761 RepID=UPI003D0D2C9A
MVAETIPILKSADFDATTSFWSTFGFADRGRWPDYLVLRHEGLAVELHFWLDPAADRWTNDVGCYVRFSDPEEAYACHASWAAATVPAPGELSRPEVKPWGALEFHVIDVHGNLVRIGGFPST